MQIILNDQTTLSAVSVEGQKSFYQNANRDSLTFIFDIKNSDFNTLYNLFQDENKTKKITITTDDTVSCYEDYTLRTQIMVKPRLTQKETPSSPAVTEESIYITMAQKTYLEKQLEKLTM